MLRNKAWKDDSATETSGDSGFSLAGSGAGRNLTGAFLRKKLAFLLKWRGRNRPYKAFYGHFLTLSVSLFLKTDRLRYLAQKRDGRTNR
jgi:hypothetical protein